MQHTIRDLLGALGEDPNREGLRETPRRVEQSLRFLTSGYEADIDALMTRQSASMDPAQRRQLFADAQRLLAEHAPALYFVAPKVIVASSARLGGVKASVLAPSVLWNADHLFLTPGRGR